MQPAQNRPGYLIVNEFFEWKKLQWSKLQDVPVVQQVQQMNSDYHTIEFVMTKLKEGTPETMGVNYSIQSTKR